MSRFGTLEEQARLQQGDRREMRVLDGVYGARLIARGELGALMGGDRSYDDVQAKWDSLPIYKEVKS